MFQFNFLLQIFQGDWQIHPRPEILVQQLYARLAHTKTKTKKQHILRCEFDHHYKLNSGATREHNVNNDRKKKRSAAE